MKIGLWASPHSFHSQTKALPIPVLHVGAWPPPTRSAGAPIKLWLVFGKLSLQSALLFSLSVLARVSLNTNDRMIKSDSCFCCASPSATCLINPYHPGWLSAEFSSLFCSSVPFTFWMSGPLLCQVLVMSGVYYSGLRHFKLETQHQGPKTSRGDTFSSMFWFYRSQLHCLSMFSLLSSAFFPAARSFQ